jgi:hypothetical protein
MELAGLEPGDLLGAIRRIVPCWRLIGFFELMKGYRVPEVLSVGSTVSGSSNVVVDARWVAHAHHAYQAFPALLLRVSVS